MIRPMKQTEPITNAKTFNSVKYTPRSYSIESKGAYIVEIVT